MPGDGDEIRRKPVQIRRDGEREPGFSGKHFRQRFSAAIHLIGRLREQEPNLFINLTTGTLPSPFWLRYADSIWRGGGDHDFDGVGSWRQKWITYRDEQTIGILSKAARCFL